MSNRRAAAAAWIAAALLLAGSRRADAQFLSDLEPERPLAMEDARPVSFHAFSGSADWTYSVRKGDLNDYGPGFSLAYGAARNLEAGAAIRWVTRPERNADRGIASGDIALHALYRLADETASRPELAVRVGLQFPTGLASKGTDLQLAALATRSFDGFRLHGNVRYARLGATVVGERQERYEGVLGFDFLPSRRLTDTVLLADVSVRSNTVLQEKTILEIEAGARRKIGPQTLVFLGAGSELTGRTDRTRLKLRIGITHVY
ncbi:MAG: hypothetical protein ABI592_11065 [Acidobacteriota bacterium]